jgi:hypothetical protein
LSEAGCALSQGSEHMLESFVNGLWRFVKKNRDLHRNFLSIQEGFFHG